MNLLGKPHPFIFTGYSVLIPSVISFLVLTILKPFNYSDYTLDQLLTWSATLSIMAGLVVLIIGGTTAYFVRRNSAEQWTVGKEIALIVSVLAVICILIFGFFIVRNPEADWKDLFMLVVARTIAISVMPIIIMVLFEQHRHQLTKRKQAERINSQLLKRHQIIKENPNGHSLPEKLYLNSENQKVALSVWPKDLICIKSDGNYIEVFHNLNGSVRMDLIRNSLKSIENQLPSKVFFRCHQRYVINLDHVRKVDGNARSLVLILDGLNEKIPVSRSRSKEMMEQFHLKATHAS